MSTTIKRCKGKRGDGLPCHQRLSYADYCPIHIYQQVDEIKTKQRKKKKK